MIELDTNQLDALQRLRSGSILHGGVGSGKSLTGLAWYYFNSNDICASKSKCPELEKDGWLDDLVIITTAKKRDCHEWESDILKWWGLTVKDLPFNCIIDSWNNIKKYVGFKNAYFIFDEQRLVGYGTWARSFLKIAKSNKWILLTATPGDTWMEYMTIMIANGYFKNKGDFCARHVVYNPYVNFPCIQRYVDVAKLERIRDNILIDMEFARETEPVEIRVRTLYDRDLYKIVEKDRWDPFKQWPVENISQYCVLLHKICNSDPSRIEAIDHHFKMLPLKKVIIFYNFTYELEILREWCSGLGVSWAEWNGQKHQQCPTDESWVYLVQYGAGCEGWNCIDTNVIFFYSLTYSYKQFTQAKGRIDRRNTPFKTLMYYIFETDSSIDKNTNECLREKKDFNERDFCKGKSILF